MYFFKESGKQILDLTGNLILSFNDSLIKTRSKSAAPYSVKDAKKIMINELTFKKKIAATYIVLGFIWGKNKALVPENTALNEPFVKPKDFVDPDNCQCENDGDCSDCPR